MTNIRDWYDDFNETYVISCDVWSARVVYELRKAVRALDIDVEIYPLEKHKYMHNRRVHDKHPWILTFQDKDDASTAMVWKLLKFCERRENWGTFRPSP